MTFNKCLAQIVEILPPGSAVTVPVDWLRTQLEADSDPQAASVADMRVKEVASKLGRSASTVRGWLAVGLIPQAYKLRGREWRVPPAGFREFLLLQVNDRGAVEPVIGKRSRVDLGAWRSCRIVEREAGS